VADDASVEPATAHRQAPGSGIPQSPGSLLGDPLTSFGKAVGLIAGAGVFVYVVGVVAFWQRMDDAGLQPQEVVASIPRDQLAVAGAREASLSLITGAAFALCLLGVYRAYARSRRSGASSGVGGRFATWMGDHAAGVVTAFFGVSCALVMPLSPANVLLLAVCLLTVYVGGSSARRRLKDDPRAYRTSIMAWAELAVGLSIAVFVVGFMRQREFPGGFACATVRLQDAAPERALYLGSTADAIIVGRPARGSPGVCGALGASRPSTVLVSRARIRQLELSAGPPPHPPSGSLLRKLGIPLECVSPVCRWRGDTFGVLDMLVPEGTHPGSG